MKVKELYEWCQDRSIEDYTVDCYGITQFGDESFRSSLTPEMIHIDKKNKTIIMWNDDRVYKKLSDAGINNNNGYTLNNKLLNATTINPNDCGNIGSWEIKEKQLTEMRIFTTDGIPTKDNIREALAYAKKNNCQVKIIYTVYGYSYEWLIDPAKSFDEIWNNRIKVYGL